MWPVISQLMSVVIIIQPCRRYNIPKHGDRSTVFASLMCVVYRCYWKEKCFIFYWKQKHSVDHLFIRRVNLSVISLDIHHHVTNACHYEFNIHHATNTCQLQPGVHHQKWPVCLSSNVLFSPWSSVAEESSVDSVTQLVAVGPFCRQHPWRHVSGVMFSSFLPAPSFSPCGLLPGVVTVHSLHKKLTTKARLLNTRQSQGHLLKWLGNEPNGFETGLCSSRVLWTHRFIPTRHHERPYGNVRVTTLGWIRTAGKLLFFCVFFFNILAQIYTSVFFAF